MKAIIILNYASEEDIGKKTSIRLKNEENEWVEKVVIKPLPNKKPVSYHDDLFGEVEKNFNNIGWNACLEELEKC